MSFLNREPKVFLGIPTHDGRVNQGVVNSIFSAGKMLSKTQIEFGSALTTNFNKLYCAALNQRENGITHFCMLHEDVWPKEPRWLDKMMEIMKRVGADVLSSVISLKDSSGLTSTGIETKDRTSHNGFTAKKLSLEECERRTPTFTDPGILLNTGLMLVDIQKSWSDKVWFQFTDSIAEKDGHYFPVAVSEDYGFTRMCREYHANLYATREIPVMHMGNGAFLNRTKQTELAVA